MYTLALPLLRYLITPVNLLPLRDEYDSHRPVPMDHIRCGAKEQELNSLIFTSTSFSLLHQLFEKHIADTSTADGTFEALQRR